ncbi:hypothetical protein MY4038_010123 [Beauveria bassiana]
MKDLASFFAESWLSGRRSEPSLIAASAKECAQMFKHLADTLPHRFQHHVTEIEEILPLLPSGDYPLVLTHGDLNEMNILVDPASGKITGVVDWAEASVQPFGFALYALDNTLGYMGPSGWKIDRLFRGPELKTWMTKIRREKTVLASFLSVEQQSRVPPAASFQQLSVLSAQTTDVPTSVSDPINPTEAMPKVAACGFKRPAAAHCQVNEQQQRLFTTDDIKTLVHDYLHQEKISKLLGQKPLWAYFDDSSQNRDIASYLAKELTSTFDKIATATTRGVCGELKIVAIYISPKAAPLRPARTPITAKFLWILLLSARNWKTAVQTVQMDPVTASFWYR